MSFTVVWILGTAATLLVVSAWNWAAMRANRRDHADVSARLSLLERLVDHIHDRLRRMETGQQHDSSR